MPRPSMRSRSVKRVPLRTPGGTSTLHYKASRRRGAHCEVCGALLAGVTTARMRLPKSRKRTSRPFGGRLCYACTAERIRRVAHGAAG